MAYNEYWQVIDGGYKPSQLVVFKYEDEGVATLEDGLYVLEKNHKDPAFVTKTAKFVKASMKGWDYVRKNPDEAVKIILAGDSTRQDREGSEADDGRSRQTARRHRREARRQGLRPHGRDLDGGWFGSRYHEEARRRVQFCDL
jgi:hypothetical protein